MWNEIQDVAKEANIFDPIKDELDQKVFRGQDPRPLVVRFIRRKIFSTLRDAFIDEPEKYFDLYLTGSLTTFQYSDLSDCDISIFPNYDLLVQLTGEDDPIEIRKELIAIVTTELDGTDLPGTSHPLQDFIQPPGLTPHDIFKEGERSAWDFQTEKWIIPPEHNRVHDVMSEMPDLFQKAQAVAEKMEILLDTGDYEGARDLYKQIHTQRSEQEKAGLGDFCEGNIKYKWLLHAGLFDRLNSEAGMHIAKVSADIDHFKVIYDFDNDEILLGTTASEGEPKDGIVIGDYDGKNVHLTGVSKQWINANYFKRLWLNSFPTRPIEKIFFDKTEIPTRPSDQLTYVQKLPHLVSADKWRSGKDWKNFIKNRGVIVDFRIGDSDDDPIEGRVVDFDSNSIKIELASGENRTFDNDLLRTIKFRLRDDKRSLSHAIASKILSELSTKLAVKYDPNYWKEAGLPYSGCFGYIGGHLIVGNTHHQAIMGNLINAGWTWDQLMEAPQAWGWFDVGTNWGDSSDNPLQYVKVNFVSDSGFQNEEAMMRACGAFASRYHLPVMRYDDFKQVKEDQYGMGLSKQKPNEGYSDKFVKDPIPAPPGTPWTPPEDKTGSTKTAVKWENGYWKKAGLPSGGCFGYINGHLILGKAHHQAIMAKLIAAGWTWEDLMNAEQAWGWFNVSYDYYKEYTKGTPSDLKPNEDPCYIWVKFTSDAGFQNDDAVLRAKGAFAQMYHLPVFASDHTTQVQNEQGYGSGLSGKEHADKWMEHPEWYKALQDVNQHYFQLPEGLQRNQECPTCEGEGRIPSYYDENDEYHELGNCPDCNGTGFVPREASMTKTADWNEIMNKAQKIRQSGGVQIVRNDPDHVVGTVQSGSDPANRGPYTTEIWRDDPQSQAITMWNCDCDWSDYSWGRTRKWKRYEGRPCCHVLALYWEGLTHPPQGDTQAPDQTPPTPTPGGGMVFNQGLIQPVGQPPLPTVPLLGEQGPAPIAPTPTQPAWSEVTQPGKEEGTISFPGTFSHWKESFVPTPPPSYQPTEMIQQQDQTAPAAQPPAGVSLPTMQQPTLDWAQEKGSPPGSLQLQSVDEWHKYPQILHANAATIQINKAEITDPRGYVAAWVGANDGSNWIQAGISSLGQGFGKPGLWIYVERMEGSNHTINYLRQIQPGAPVNVSVLNNHNVWTIYVDNHPSGQVTLNPRGYISVDAVAESMATTQPNNWNWHFSNVHKTASWKEAAFNNGDIVRTWDVVNGMAQSAYGQPGYPVKIPKNKSGEVIYSDDETSIVIFPLSTGPLQHHLVKVECPTSSLYLDNTNAQPFIKRHR